MTRHSLDMKLIFLYNFNGDIEGKYQNSLETTVFILLENGLSFKLSSPSANGWIGLSP